ncbi:hypothetical protein [Micromonospora sediminimaris]|uniref:Uncharacterized protein n=1 Tax=Micromonospora sediminimaris TaxID=547162 RepID=A0A9W5UUT2_9ACTN|nr:hypothetical protein [Micromonospora sediminimaris]GIJ34768.1 hypothetical protein Vse01_39160 [Micromonospora sediminimaris]SFD52816.1 hypothetical protein SAMN05216284_11894 [Micromonospora sediminimaris]
MTERSVALFEELQKALPMVYDHDLGIARSNLAKCRVAASTAAPFPSPTDPGHVPTDTADSERRGAT